MNNPETIDFARRFSAECIGTILLAAILATATVGIANNVQFYFLFVPFAIGLSLMVLTAIFGSVSGGHFNPGVTLAVFIAGGIKAQQAVINIIAQVIGGYIGVQLARVFISALPPTPISMDSRAFIAEAIGAFILSAAVVATVHGKVPNTISPLVIGSALIIGSTLALAASGGILNPAIALGMGGYHLSYILAPFLGAALAGAFIPWVLHTTKSK